MNERYVRIETESVTNTKGKTSRTWSTLADAWLTRKDMDGNSVSEDGKRTTIEQSVWEGQYIPSLKANDRFYELEDTSTIYTIKAISEITRKGLIRIRAEQRY